VSGRFDSHIHLFEHGYSGDRPAGAELADYLALRQVHGIDRALVVGYEGEPAYAGNNDHILRLAVDHPWIHPVLYLAETARRLPDAVRSGSAAGVSLYPTRPVATELWDEIDSVAAVVSVNVPAHRADLIRDAVHVERAGVLVSHLGLPGAAGTPGDPLRDRLRTILDLAVNPRIFVKLSGLYAIDPRFPHAGARAAFELIAEAFGLERLCWGSDFSPALDVVSTEQAMTLPEWVAGQLRASERDAVLGGNLRRLLGGLG
jgi:predicted TIM-barrel fold metal-dependent hydrolase